MRLFLAVELDAAARTQCDGLLSALQRSLGPAANALRWTPADNIHITMHFFGEVDRHSTDRLIAALDTSLPQPSFSVSTSTFGVFPGAGPPKVVWLGIDAGRDALVKLHAQSSERIERAGFVPEARAFSPHLTVARVRDRDRGMVRALRAQMAGVSSHPIEWRVDHLTLFESDLSGPAPRYMPRARIELFADAY